MAITTTQKAPPRLGAGTRTALASYVEFTIVWAAISAGLYMLGEYLFAHGFISLNLLFFAEKARLAIAGEPPRLVNIGFVYPPLSFILMMPFNNPVVAQAVIAGATLTGVFRFLDHRVTDDTRRRIAKSYMLISPVFLFLTVENYGFLLLAVLLALAVFYLGRYIDYGYSLYLFAAGTLYGLTFFIDFRTIVLLIVLIPAVVAPLYRKSLPQAISVSLTIALPLIFMAAAWIYVNWIFLGDGLAFVSGRSSFFRTFVADTELLSLSGDAFATLAYAAKLLVISLPVTCCYFVGLGLLRSNVSAYLLPTWAIYCFPIVMMSTTLYAGIFAPAVSFLSFFLLTFFFELPRMRRSKILVASMIVSFAFSFIGPLYSPNSEERQFTQAIFTGHVQPNIDEYEQVSGYLLQHEGGRILVDDTIFYPVVYLVNEPRRFILPYQYDFDTALANPRAMARFVVGSRNAHADGITSIHQTIADGYLRDYNLVFSTKNYFIFERKVS